MEDIVVISVPNENHMRKFLSRSIPDGIVRIRKNKGYVMAKNPTFFISVFISPATLLITGEYVTHIACDENVKSIKPIRVITLFFISILFFKHYLNYFSWFSSL